MSHYDCPVCLNPPGRCTCKPGDFESKFSKPVVPSRGKWEMKTTKGYEVRKLSQVEYEGSRDDFTIIIGEILSGDHWISAKWFLDGQEFGWNGHGNLITSEGGK